MIMFIITYKNFLQVFNFPTAVIFDHFKFMSLMVGLTTTRTTCASTGRPAFSSSSARNVNFFVFSVRRPGGFSKVREVFRSVFVCARLAGNLVFQRRGFLKTRGLHFLSHMCHESGLLIGSQQVSFFRTNLLFPNLPAFLFYR